MINDSGAVDRAREESARVTMEYLLAVARDERPAHAPDLANKVLAVYYCINRAERCIREALRVGCGQGEEFIVAAHQCLTATGVVTGHPKKS